MPRAMGETRPLRTLLPLLLLLSAFPPAAGQADLYDFKLSVAEPRDQYEVVAVGGTGRLDVDFVFLDLSYDSPASLVPGSPDPGATDLSPHRVRIQADIVSEHHGGWQILYSPTGFQSYAGDERRITLTAQITPQAANPFMAARLNVTLTPELQPDVQETRSVEVNFYTRGVAGFQPLPLQPLDLRPSERQETRIQLTNSATLPRTFAFEILDNPCDLLVVPPSGTTLRPRETKVISFSVEAPEERFWYWGTQCTFRVGVYAVDNPGNVQEVTIGTVVDGFYVAPEWIFRTAGIALAALVILLIAKRRKERIEEELLGKPQKPWTIPVEQVYLQHLKRKDERAWYVVRHYLMEDEYKSALLWYRDYKTATRAGRTKERVVLRHERAYEKWKARWQRRIEAPELAVERLEGRLQKRLDREARATYRKAKRRHRSLIRKMRKAHEKQVARAQEKWQKQARRAEKKGRPAPEEPVMPEPDYPEEPRLERVLLADHKWARKVERARRKAVRKRGDLEVRFEKADARHLQAVRRKVRRVARKIDDPEFVRQHPLLSDGG